MEVLIIHSEEFGLKNGITVDEAKGIAPYIETAGADLLQVRVTGYGNYLSMLLPEHLLYPELPKNLDLGGMDVSRGGKGIIVPLASAIKKQVRVPVACAGRLDPIEGEDILRQGKLDFIGMTRGLVADPELPNKVASGRLQEIVPCAGCGYCVHSRKGDSPMKCRMNAAAGKEREYAIIPVQKKKQVLIIGGGLAGMEAARVASLRGHNVTLCEKVSKLGGLLPLAAIVKERELEALIDTVRYYEAQLTQLGVTLKLGTTADVAMIRNFKPDAVVLGTGGLHATLDIPGIDNRKVIRSEELHRTLKKALRFFGPKTLERLTRLWMPLGKRVVIIGGAIQGCQLAHFLAVRNRKVTIVETADTFGDGLPFQSPQRLFNWFDEKGVIMLPGVTYERITDEGLVVTTREGARKVLEADSIVLALPLMPDSSLCKALEKDSIQVFQIGDCRDPGLMHGAIADGAQIGRNI